MNRSAKIAAVAGLALATGIVAWLGAGKVLEAAVRVGWRGLLIVALVQLAVFVLLGAAWWLVCPGISPAVAVWGRLVREAGVNCLPFSGIGGMAIGARAVMLGGASLSLAAASSVVDVITEGIGLAPLAILGVVVLLTRAPGSPLVLPCLAGAGILLAGGGLVLLGRRQLSKVLRWATALLLQRWVAGAPRFADELHRRLDDLFRQRWRIAGSSAIHLLGWCGGGAYIWIGYRLLGAAPTFLEAIAIESLFSVALAAGFLVPGGFGVQELGYVAIGRLFGLPAPLSLTLSLLRRARDLLIGAPSLLIWQAAEVRRLRKPADTSSAQRPAVDQDASSKTVG